MRKNPHPDVTIDDITLRGGILDLRSGIRNLTLTNNIDYYAGRVLADFGSTLTPA